MVRDNHDGLSVNQGQLSLQVKLMGDFGMLGGSRLTNEMSVDYVIMSMRKLPRTKKLSGKSAAT